jgi:hypothetical protein
VILQSAFMIPSICYYMYYDVIMYMINKTILV